MLAWNVTEEQIRQAADEVGLQISDGGYNRSVPLQRTGKTDRSPFRFTLKLDTSKRRADKSLPYQRVSMNRNMEGRRVAAVCWHGHRDFMRVLFALAPDMRLKSALADYRGADDFESTYRSTSDSSNGWNVGLSYGDACTCESHERMVVA